MSKINSSCPGQRQASVDEQVSTRDCCTRRECEREQLREMLLAGAASSATDPVAGAYFDGLRERVRSPTPQP